MTGQLTPVQTIALRHIAGVEQHRRRPWPQTLEALEKKGLIDFAFSLQHIRATPLGKAVAMLRGWIPSEIQRDLIEALAANGEILASTEYFLPRYAPSPALRSFEARGLATRRDPALPTWLPTELCRKVAADLRGEVSP